MSERGGSEGGDERALALVVGLERREHAVGQILFGEAAKAGVFERRPPEADLALRSEVGVEEVATAAKDAAGGPSAPVPLRV